MGFIQLEQRSSISTRAFSEVALIINRAGKEHEQRVVRILLMIRTTLRSEKSLKLLGRAAVTFKINLPIRKQSLDTPA